MLYFRSILLLVITLYISRVVLKALGEEDFGVYSLIGGVVAMFNMIGATLTTASQRFITFSLGKGDFNDLKKVFTNSMTLHLILGIIVVILLEVCGYWLIYNQLNIPEHRIGAAYIVLQCSILTFFVKIISIPFDALIIAHEKMSAFAYISLLEGIFRLLAAYILIYYGYDKLILHAFLQLGVSVIQRFIYSAYSHHKFPESKNIKLTIDTEVFRQMFSFTSWNFFGQASSIIRTHGIDIILNLFFGVTINAAKGVCNQVQHGVTQLTSNFQTAIRPQLTKAIAIGDDARTYDLIIQGTRFSFYLMTIMSIIIMVYCQEILSLWLEDVPYFAVEFAQLTLIFLLLDAQSRFLMHSMLSKGDIKEYKMIIMVNCRDAQISSVFNLMYFSNRIVGSETLSGSYLPTSASASQYIENYTVDSNGDIEFPVLGKIHVEGLRREEVAEKIKTLLVEGNQAKDPVVVVEMTNLGVSVLGEVKAPGRFRLDRDRFTLLDAISVAGDLTIYGDRKNVTVIRHGKEGDEFYKMNLTQGADIYASPAFFLQQGDVIYVAPNRKRAGDSSVNGNTVKSASFWVSVGSFVTSTAVLINNLVKNK